MSDTPPDQDRPDVPDKTAPTAPDSGDEANGVHVDGNVEGDVKVAPPPATSTPEAAPGQPEGDVKPAETSGDGGGDQQASPENQELQETGSAPDRPDDSAVAPPAGGDDSED